MMIMVVVGWLQVLPDVLPPNDYIEYFKPDYRLHLDPASELQF